MQEALLLPSLLRFSFCYLLNTSPCSATVWGPQGPGEAWMQEVGAYTTGRGCVGQPGVPDSLLATEVKSGVITPLGSNTPVDCLD